MSANDKLLGYPVTGDMVSHQVFATNIHHTSLVSTDGWQELNDDLEAMAMSLAEDDEPGIEWCEENGYDGYTSYSSLDDLTQRATCFATLGALLQKQAEAFAERAEWDLRGRKIVLDNVWVNVLEPGGSHSGHIHPHCVISGTYYVGVPDGASSIRFEDPRLGMMMATPSPMTDAGEANKRFVSIAPKAGDLLMWESWLRHEVAVNRADDVRVSVSFNFRLD